MDDIVKESMMSDLSLVSYSFLMSLKSEDDYSNALERMFDDDAVIAFGTVDNPFFTTVGEVKKETTTNDTSSFKLDEFIKSGTGLVKTVWKFKSQLYNSLAVVSDDRGIVYDNIGWYLVSKKDSRTKSELEDEPDTSAVAATNSVDFCKWDEGSNLLGMMLYSYRITCTSTFEDRVLVDISMEAESEQHLGWSCTAPILLFHTMAFH